MLDGWPLIAALAADRRVDAWRTDAERLAGLVVSRLTAAGLHDHADAARGFVCEQLAMPVLRTR